ncbi:hypothetical protein [Chitinophaga japonensis]|uniref:GIY-YIG domain-containing protein n=1 Tax=Chitinophaga japonensis TaxID=104662 RepID=A0A562TBE9_CHIJA|nr:hypothetical protein [Chitinophaga japonensis]TWI90899.1 hypothetical protein LX66_0260 [Chitinophaga japonensis]
MKNNSTTHINERINWLNNHLLQALNSPTLLYNDVLTVKSDGLYIIFKEPDSSTREYLYVGQTSRKGKIRMRELASDFRSHTFNKKLLEQRFREIGMQIGVLSNKVKAEWIKSGIISEEDFRTHQRYVNSLIKTSLKFKFYEYKYTDILSLEHFATAVLHPFYND